MFNASRLKDARMRRGLSKKRLAEMSSISLRSLHQYESGSVVPGESVLNALAQTLRFPAEFFEAESLHVPSAQAVSFRALAKMTTAHRDASLVAGAIAIDLFDWIEAKFSLPSANIPESLGLGPEACAEMVRESWGLGTKPIRNVLHALEFHGVRVCSLPEEHSDVDAFSFWRSGTPYMLLNTLKSGERGRFDAAHELGHLVMHRDSLVDVRTRELEAQRFAAAFLMPRAHFFVAGGVPGLDHIRELKARWGVSAMAYAHRLHEVGYVSAWLYRILCIQMSQLGWRTHEPDPMQRESSQVLEKVFRALRAKGMNRRDVAHALRVTPDELNAYVFRLTMSGVEGTGSQISGDSAVLPELNIIEGGRPLAS